jgi:hypothetical protein
MEPPVPPEALERAEPIVRALQEQLRPLLERLPEPPESAIQFQMPEEP